MYRILIADDEPHIRWAITRTLKGENIEILETSNGKECLQKFDSFNPHLVILDLKMPELDGMQVLKSIKSKKEDVPVIIITAYGTIETAIEAMKSGAYDYITKPFDIDELKIHVFRALNMNRLEKEVRYLRDQLDERLSNTCLETSNPAMINLYRMIDRIACADTSVLITGESGTGKEIIAKLIHHKSGRGDKPFVSINCAAIPESLVESELFGYEKGAFTGALSKKPGKFELADGGTLFLDEVGELSLNVQAKLLRAIQEKAFERLGGTCTVKVDVRIIAATNKNLQKAVEEGKFRDDLYYRINVINLEVPPLRFRKEDIPRLVETFINKYQRGSKKISVSDEAVEAMLKYDWPGNIRELENCIERALIICDGDYILPKHLPFASNIRQDQQNCIVYFPDEGIDLERVEKELIRIALRKSNGNQTKAAKLLNITRSALIYRMQKYNLT
jgi:two-component system NtrC family response regulator